VPASLIAAAVLLTLFVPGYLFQYGVREHTNVLTADRDVYAVAQAVAISAGMLLAVFLVLKLLSLDGVEDSLLHDPGSAKDRGLTVAQAIMLVLLLVFSNAAGKVFGRIMSRRRATRLDPKQAPTGLAKMLHRALDPFFSTSTIDKEIDRVITNAPAYVRVVRQGNEDVIGFVDAPGAEASASSLGSGLALSSRWSYEPGVGWQRLGSAHVPKPGIITILWCTAKQADSPPAWLRGVLTAEQASRA